MEELTTYKGVRIDDTGDWRLTVHISSQGMGAWLKNIAEPTEPIATLFVKEWTKDDETLLQRIETEVYDHPQLFDDFSTDVVLTTGKALWVPLSELTAPGSEIALYNRVYNAEEEDLFADELDNKVCLYTLTPGLRGFLQRTLPGARTWCHQSVAVKRFSERGADMPRVYVDIREKEADFYLFDDKKLLLAATHPWNDANEIMYHIFNIVDVYGLDFSECQVSLSGKRDVKGNLMEMLRDRFKYVMSTMKPSVMAGSDMPMSVAMVMSR